MEESYEKSGQLGQGSFGIVYKVQKKSDKRIFCCKELHYGVMSEKEKQQLVSEVNIIREFNHPNIVKYYERIIDKKLAKIYIITEYCQNGDLAQLLKRCKKDKDYIAEDVIWKIFFQLTIALNECHNRCPKILHRDIKPANVFLDEHNNIKLGDFGLSRILSENSQFCKTHVGTPYYMSPEQINEALYDERSDIWSFGCLLYELAAFHPPFEATNHLSLAIKIKAAKFERIPMRYSEDLQFLIEKMLDPDPNNRPTINELLKLQQVQIRLKERKVKERHSQIKQREEELRQWEQQLKNQKRKLK